MKRILSVSLFALFAIAFTSCKKDSNPSPNNGNPYLTVKLDGTKKDFTQATVVKSNLGMGIYSLTIQASSENEGVYINLWSGADDFTTGKTYNIDAPSASTSNVLGYASPITTADPVNIWMCTYAGTGDQYMSVTITEATDTYVKGTFSGRVYQQSDASENHKEMTEGSFFIKF